MVRVCVQRHLHQCIVHCFKHEEGGLLVERGLLQLLVQRLPPLLGHDVPVQIHEAVELVHQHLNRVHLPHDKFIKGKDHQHPSYLDHLVLLGNLLQQLATRSLILPLAPGVEVGVAVRHVAAAAVVKE